MRTLIVLLVLYILASSVFANTDKFVQDSAAKPNRSSDLKVSLFADKVVYRPKDDLSLNVMIINDSGINDTFIYGILGFGSSASFRLFRRDAKGREVPTRFIDDFRGNPPDVNDPTSFVKLRPGHYLGITYENSIYNLNLEKPGKYRLWVEYHSPVSESEVKVNPFWGTEKGAIKSNVIEIQVRP